MKWHNGPFCRAFFTSTMAAAIALLRQLLFGLLLLNEIVLHLCLFFSFSSCLLSCSQAFVYFILVSIFECIFSIPTNKSTHRRMHAQHTHAQPYNTIFGGHCRQSVKHMEARLLVFVDDLQNKLTKNEHFVLVYNSVQYVCYNMLCYVV